MPLARAAKRLKRLKTAMGGYWKKLAWIWVWRHSAWGRRHSAWGWRHVGLGLAPPRLGRAGAGRPREGCAPLTPAGGRPRPWARRLRPRRAQWYAPRLRPFYEAQDGGVAERSKAHAWKVCIRETVSRVRIPPPPPALNRLILKLNMPRGPARDAGNRG
jgi:hypothetical protein